MKTAYIGTIINTWKYYKIKSSYITRRKEATYPQFSPIQEHSVDQLSYVAELSDISYLSQALMGWGLGDGIT